MYSGIMQYLPGRHNRIYYLIEELKDFIASRVKINEASLDPQNPRDFIDCFLTAFTLYILQSIIWILPFSFYQTTGSQRPVNLGSYSPKIVPSK